jgi:cupin superfamily acireductone dioxygenase involved in methionine salvage
MESIATLTEALGALSGARDRIKSLEADLKAAQLLLDEQSASLASARADLDAAKAAAAHVQNANEIRINEVLASVGVAPVDVVQEAKPAKSREELWAEYHALDLHARNEFFAKNKAQLSTLN